MTKNDIKSFLESNVDGTPKFYFGDSHYMIGCGYGKYSYAYICCDSDNSCGSNDHESYNTADELLNDHFDDMAWEQFTN